MNIKIFSGYQADRVEKAVNIWANEHKNIRILSTHFAMSTETASGRQGTTVFQTKYSAAIYYEEQTE